MAQAPTAQAMSREGKGTDAATEAGRSQPLPWSEAERRMAGGGWFWLATVRPDGAPHVMPLFAAWANTSFFIASKDRARKSRNLEVEPRCVISTDTGDLHLIVEGTARHVRDEATLRRAVDAFSDRLQLANPHRGEQVGRRLRRTHLRRPSVRGL